MNQWNRNFLLAVWPPQAAMRPWPAGAAAFPFGERIRSREAEAGRPGGIIPLKMARTTWRRSLVMVLAVAFVAAIIVFGVLTLRSADRASNERIASTTLKQFTSAEAEFRANDRDRNGVNDFWTGDVSGLYSLTVDGHELQLIPREV